MEELPPNHPKRLREEAMLARQSDPQYIMEQIVLTTQERLDDFAKTRNYSGILSACTYSTSSIPKFSAEGQRCINLRDQTWAALYTVLAEVQAGTRPMPESFSSVKSSLPLLTWE